jgi:fumarate hydratase class II
MGSTGKDFLGTVEIPDGKLYGACTQRTLNTCSIGDHRVPLELISAIVVIKCACAVANNTLGKLPHVAKETILKCAELLQTGEFDSNFTLCVFQNGAGTSTNMNVNEVISCLAREKFNVTLHPNDDVNMSQSTNDVVASAVNVSCSIAIGGRLVDALGEMFGVLSSRAEEWKHLLKIGRTHLRDAVPMTLGQEFSAYARQVEKCIERCRRAVEILEEIPIGGSVIGTGLNVPPGFAEIAIAEINRRTGLNFMAAKNKFCEQASKDSLVELAGIVNSITAALGKIASDLRILSSGPNAAIGELELPATQEGSSIMPGKINPAMCEMVIQACHYVNGMMLVVLLGARNGELQLNTALSVTSYALLDSINLLANCARNFSKYCLVGLRPNGEILRENVKKSAMLITAAAGVIGYDAAADVVAEALASGESVAAVLGRKNLLGGGDVDSICDPWNMVDVQRREFQ